MVFTSVCNFMPHSHPKDPSFPVLSVTEWRNVNEIIKKMNEKSSLAVKSPPIPRFDTPQHTHKCRDERVRSLCVARTCVFVHRHTHTQTHAEKKKIRDSTLRTPECVTVCGGILLSFVSACRCWSNERTEQSARFWCCYSSFRSCHQRTPRAS